VGLWCSWNQLDVLIVVMSVVGIALEEVRSGIIPINPTIIRVMRVLRIARGTHYTRYYFCILYLLHCPIFVFSCLFIVRFVWLSCYQKWSHYIYVICGEH